MSAPENDADAGLHSIHPKAIPNALKVQQDAISKLQRTLRQEVTKLQAEEVILKVMIKRERKRLARRRQPAPASAGPQPGAPGGHAPQPAANGGEQQQQVLRPQQPAGATAIAAGVEPVAVREGEGAGPWWQTAGAGHGTEGAAARLAGSELLQSRPVYLDSEAGDEGGEDEAEDDEEEEEVELF